MKWNVDTATFKELSPRSAFSLKAGLRGSSTAKKLKRESWPIKSTWKRFYYKSVVKQEPKYQDMIFH